MYGKYYHEQFKAIKYVGAFFWAIKGYSITADSFQQDHVYPLLWQILSILAWLVWLFLLWAIYKELKKAFGKN
ncbi:hypothetical protein [Aureitalea marina]|uniref:Uncharacterized protein n=1 Tax=Aureitalea marina TaxID=930804 RepID=A0A2S7KT20_9FLAO|nr:hypothetical protein [Aureitalea marina]PQB05728.1 hypothetical protein BST85_13085 [Aureitalea marina]